MRAGTSRREHIMKYVMLIAGNGNWDLAYPDDMQAGYDEIYAYLGKWEKLGKVVDGGAELDHPNTAKTVRGDADGAFTVADGPFLELKEFLGGFIILECDDVDEAVAVASEWPGIKYGEAVEVRPVITH
jgi:hypothetical protein